MKNRKNKGRNRKKVVLFLVEGQSEIMALAEEIEKLYDDVNTVSYFQMPYFEDGNKEGGDITTRSYVNASNIESKIIQIFLKGQYGAFKKNKICVDDIEEIIHIVDTDGIYIPDDCIMEKNTDRGGFVYETNKICVPDKDRAIDRNKRKRNVIDKLVSLDHIFVDNKKVKYSVYFFSCNLDHYLYDKRNLMGYEKIAMAKRFSDMCIDDSQYFIDIMCNLINVPKMTSYKKSWEYIKKGIHSLERGSNLGVLIRRLISLQIQSQDRNDAH